MLFPKANDKFSPGVTGKPITAISTGQELFLQILELTPHIPANKIREDLLANMGKWISLYPANLHSYQLRVLRDLPIGMNIDTIYMLVLRSDLNFWIEQVRNSWEATEVEYCRRSENTDNFGLLGSMSSERLLRLDSLRRSRNLGDPPTEQEKDMIHSHVQSSTLKAYGSSIPNNCAIIQIGWREDKSNIVGQEEW